MFLLFLFSDEIVQDIVAQTLDIIKKGDGQAREDFISRYRPFILKSVARVTGNYIQVENNEEYSIGLLAFNEAIDSYDPDKSNNFFRFAQEVIRRRVIDYLRRSKKDSSVYPFTYLERGPEDDFAGRYLQEYSDVEFKGLEIREEIEAFEKRLGLFGITMEDLVLSSPRHADSKQLSIRIARIIVDNEPLFTQLFQKKNIPMNDLVKICSFHQRTVERHRKFIIAICLILRSNLEVLQSYVLNAEKGGKG